MQKYFESVVSSNGSAVQGASISVYSYGTSTLASIYSDSTGSASKTNPITTDNNGYFEFYAADGRYSITVSGAGIGTRTITDIQLDDPNSASPLVASTLVVNGQDYTNLYSNMTAQTTAAATSATQAATARDAAIAAWAASMNPAETLPSISKSLHYGAIVKSIIYDTSKDSDGGAWRKRCTDKSWYTETLGFTGTWGGQAASVAAGWAACGSVTGGAYQSTADGKFYTPTSASTQTEIFRGNKAEFPEQVAIVAETGRVVIYDLTQVGCPMWMVFSNAGMAGYSTAISSISAQFGQLLVGAANGLTQINFISEVADYWQPGNHRQQKFISTRNSSALIAFNSVYIVNGTVNDVAITVLDTAPIDPATGLPVPTIAVATAGGVSVIKDDGTVASDTQAVNVTAINIKGTTLYSFGSSSTGYVALRYNFGSVTGSAVDKFGLSTGGDAFYRSGGNIPLFPYATASQPVKMAGNGYGINTTLGMVSILKENPATPTKGMVSYITQSYNTGWMPGDIRGAYLADTTAETITDGTSGTELVTNGTFTTDTSSWTASNATFTQVGSAGQLTNSTTTTGYAYQAITTVVGKNYTVSCAFTKGTAAQGSLMAGTVAGGSTLGQVFSTVTAPLTFNFTATTTTTYITLFNSDIAAGVISTFDNVSCKLNGELVTNGTFPTDTSGWTAANSGVTSFVAGVMRITNGAALNGYAYQAITTVVGKNYQLSISITNGTSTGGCFIGTTIGSGNIAGVPIASTTGTYLLTFVATTTTTYVTPIIDAVSGHTCDFDNISVKLADPDRSVKNTGLVLNGTLTKTAVASGAALVAYSGFSASNYLEQPYNVNLDFGTGDFCVMGWVNISTPATAQFIFDRGTVAGGRIALILSGGVYFYACHATTISATTSVTATAGLHFVALYRSAGNIFLNIDGVQVYTAANTNNCSNTSAAFDIGVGYDHSSPCLGSMSLWRISATAPSADQISHIYRTELPLFQAGAQCTIAGTSTAVTALAYDDVADTLHVGTSWGRSGFRDLLRVDSEATTVGAVTSVSANEGAVVTGGATTGKFAQPATVIRDELRRKDISRKALGKIPVPFDYTATASQTAFVLPKGYTAKTFQKNGTFVRENSGSPNFVRSDDGFQETCTLSAGATVGDWIQIMAVRK